MKIFYKTRATATGGRSGHTALDDGSLAFDLAAHTVLPVGCSDMRRYARRRVAALYNIQDARLAAGRESAEASLA